MGGLWLQVMVGRVLGVSAPVPSAPLIAPSPEAVAVAPRWGHFLSTAWDMGDQGADD